MWDSGVLLGTELMESSQATALFWKHFQKISTPFNKLHSLLQVLMGLIRQFCYWRHACVVAGKQEGSVQRLLTPKQWCEILCRNDSTCCKQVSGSKTEETQIIVSFSFSVLYCNVSLCPCPLSFSTCYFQNNFLPLLHIVVMLSPLPYCFFAS